MNTNAQKWVAALRSGEYPQAKGELGGPDGYCCLGVACKLYEDETGVALPKTGKRYTRTTLQGAYHPVAEWVGLRCENGTYTHNGCVLGACLAEDNDTGKTFPEIADIIESEPDGLFQCT